MFEFDGAIATAPMNSVDCESVNGVHVADPLPLRLQTPPPAAAMKIRFASVGSAAMPVMRPAGLPEELELIGAGPINVHAEFDRGILLDSSVRRSSGSTIARILRAAGIPLPPDEDDAA